MLADRGVLPDLQGRGLPCIFEVLRPVADRREREDPAAAADAGASRNHDMGDELHLVAKLHIAADHTIGADLDVLAQRRAILDDGGGMDGIGHYWPSTITIAPTSASAMRVVPTMARASYQPIALRRRILRMWYSITSPGRAGLRNLHLSTVTM